MRSCYMRFLSPIRKHHDRVVMLKLAFSTHFINKTKRDRKQHDSRGVTRPRPPSFSLCCYYHFVYPLRTDCTLFYLSKAWNGRCHGTVHFRKIGNTASIWGSPVPCKLAAFERLKDEFQHLTWVSSPVCVVSCCYAEAWAIPSGNNYVTNLRWSYLSFASII